MSFGCQNVNREQTVQYNSKLIINTHSFQRHKKHTFVTH